MAERKTLQTLGAGLLMLGLPLGSGGSRAAQGSIGGPTTRLTVAKESYRGGVVTPPLPKPRFTLTDTSGAPFDFWAKTQGYVTLLFFGYTQCPDECPLHMSNVATSLHQL